jgi:amidophosphoribosyltransferase
MSEPVKHECGIALLRLLKPLEYYHNKYGTALYGIEKMSLLLEKQHNRGQDGAGLICLKLDTPPGKKYFHWKKSNSSTAIKDIFQHIIKDIKATEAYSPKQSFDIDFLKEELSFAGEIFLGHLRYGTFGNNHIEFVHPIIRMNNWKSKSIALAGNFNLTNVEYLFNKLISYGEHPLQTSDTVTIIEKIGYFLDKEHDSLWQKFINENMNKTEATEKAAEELDFVSVMQKSAKYWDGGYVISGILGNGSAFIMRDPAGIRPAYYYADDELFVAASERPAIQTAFNTELKDIQEVEPGTIIIVHQSGKIIKEYVKTPVKRASCSFERIYFSRGTDADIYKERKSLGKALCPKILSVVNNDFENTVFSFIPNTATVAFMGLREALFTHLNTLKRNIAIAYKKGEISQKEFDLFFKIQPRIETIAVKDIKLRTFITQDVERDDLVAHVYDVTYGIIKNNIDTLVVLDDSIVRGTTLKQSIIRILDRLHPKKIIIASSAPQIRYPDCYGIDMAKLSDFIAFRAAIELLHETKQQQIINEVYMKCKYQIELPMEEMLNHVKLIYKHISADQISEKISAMLKPEDVKADVQIIYQTIEDLHASCPEHTGDWYFTGNYPTPGGNKVVTQSFINFIENKNERGYSF